MSQHAKTLVAAVAAVLLAGVQAWQTAVNGAPFHPVDALPIAIAIAGAVLVHVIPNTGDQPVAKAVIAGVLAALNGAASLLAGNPASVTVLDVVVAVLGALVTWYMPELDPEIDAVKAAADLAAAADAGRPVDPGEITDALKALERLDPAQAALDATAAQATVELPAVRATPTPAPAAAAVLAVEPTPLADEALAAARTVVLPVIPTPAAPVS